MSTQPVSPASGQPTDRSTSKTEVINQSELRQELKRAEDKIDALKKELNDDTPIDLPNSELPNMVERDGALFRADPADKKMEGPFCIRCFKKTGKLVPVLPMPETFAMSASAEWDCGACKLVQ